MTAPETIMARSCELVLAHCPLDIARGFARAAEAELARGASPEKLASWARLMVFELRSWSTPLGRNLRETFQRLAKEGV